jgi:hypothetical protein
MAAFHPQPEIQLTSMPQLALVGQANLLEGPDYAKFVKAVDKEDDWTRKTTGQGSQTLQPVERDKTG